MSTPFLGQINVFSFNFPPKGWAFCNGQLLPINQNQALFSLLGTVYGGDGQTNFALPNLQGQVVLGVSGGYPLGNVGGEVQHTLNLQELAGHSHVVNASTGAPTAAIPTNNYTAQYTGGNLYSTATPDTTLGPGSAVAGGSQPHNNMQPYLVLNFCIALSGVFPSRN